MKSNESLRKDFKAGALPYLDSLWHTSFCLTRSQAKAAELVQQSFVKSLERWSQADGQTECRALLLKSLAELYLLESPGRAGTNEPETELIAANNPAIEESLSLKSIPCSLLGKAIANIPHDIRLLIILSIYWGLTYNEIAEIVGSELESVRAKMQAGRLQLRLELARALSRSGYLDTELIETT